MGNPINTIVQAWEDYKIGRRLRKERESLAASEKLNADYQSDIQQRRKGWQRRSEREYPWRIERVIQQDENCRGTWVLEVRDMWDVEWEMVKVYDGKGWRWESVPRSHWPFMEEKEKGEDGFGNFF